MSANLDNNLNSPGLLDISVELSSEHLFAGSEFTVYVLLKNPFGRPLWVEEVKVSVPSQMYWRKESTEEFKDKTAEPEDELDKIDPLLVERISQHRSRVEQLQKEIDELEAHLNAMTNDDQDGIQETLETKKRLLSDEVNQLFANEQHLYGLLGYEMIGAWGRGSMVRVEEMRSQKPLVVTALGGGIVNLDNYQREHPVSPTVQLESSLPAGQALQPGSTAVWEIRLGTRSSILFLPAQYRLQFNVRYSFEAPPEEGRPGTIQRVFRVDTSSKQLTIRASMQAVMLGALIGGVAGSLARAVQLNESTANLFANANTIVLQVLLSSVLSVAAVIFAARKSETQSFVSVEDFWGGALIGFLVGFTGTTAFGQLTNTAPSQPNLPSQN